MRRRGGIHTSRILLATAALVIVVLSAAAFTTVALVNRRVLPGAVESAILIAADRGVDVTVGSVGYRPFRGVVAAGIGLAADVPGFADRLTVSIDSIRIPLDVATIRRLTSARNSGIVDPWAAAAVLPTRFVVAGVVSSVGATVHSAVVEHRADEGIVTLATERRGGSAVRPGQPASGPRGTTRPADTGRRAIVPVDADLRVEYAARRVAATAAATDIPLTAEAVGSGTADITLSVHAEPDRAASISGDIALRGTRLTLPLLASEPVLLDRLAYQFEAELAEALAVTRGVLNVGNVSMSVRPTLRGRSSAPLIETAFTDIGELLGALSSVEITTTLEDAPVAEIISAVPEAVSGPIARARLAGTIDWRLDLTVPIPAVGDMAWQADTAVTDFAVAAIPGSVNPFVLNDEFIYRIVDPEVGYSRTVRVPVAVEAPMALMLEHTEHTRRQIRQWRRTDSLRAPPPQLLPSDSTRIWAANADDTPAADPSYRFVRLDEMSPWIIRAVLTTEDGDFFFHDGVNFLTLVDAIERNVREGEVAVGASTLTMQLAKMLFLDAERTLARKLQEVFLVYLIEEVVPVSKDRILELYLNVAEFGPGVFGIADGADYYFAKDPADLTAGEATWLASILPSPKRYHRYYEEGGISPGWFIRMQSYFDIMLERERMTEEEHREASAAPPEFTVRRPG